MRTIALALAPLLLAGQCQDNAPRTAEAECRIFEGPPHAVQTVTRASQLWADETISIGIRVCGWDRPGAPSPDEVLVQIGSGRWLPDVRSSGVKLAPSAAATSVDACPFDVAREDRRRLAIAVEALRQASEAEKARLRASYGVSRRQFAACLADAEAALR